MLESFSGNVVRLTGEGHRSHKNGDGSRTM